MNVFIEEHRGMKSFAAKDEITSEQVINALLKCVIFFLKFTYYIETYKASSESIAVAFVVSIKHVFPE